MNQKSITMTTQLLPNTWRKWPIALAFSLVCLCTSAQPPRALIVLAGATALSDIGPGCNKSIDLMHQTFQNIGNYTGMQTDFLFCTGYSYTRDRILETLEQIPVGQYQLLVFYNTSHGFNYLDAPSPHTFFIAHPTHHGQLSAYEFEYYGLSLELEVRPLLESKGAELLLLMSESCNTIIPVTMPELYVQMDARVSQRLRELFLEAKGVVTISSSSLGQASYTDNEKGGYFTNAFNHALNDLIASPERVSWSQLLDRASSYTSAYADLANLESGQEPLYDLEVIEPGLQPTAPNPARKTANRYEDSGIELKKEKH